LKLIDSINLNAEIFENLSLKIAKIKIGIMNDRVEGISDCKIMVTGMEIFKACRNSNSLLSE
jgi:hypothetical protein